MQDEDRRRGRVKKYPGQYEPQSAGNSRSMVSVITRLIEPKLYQPVNRLTPKIVGKTKLIVIID